MLIVVGGSHQGKLAFAMQWYDLTKEDVADLAETPGKKLSGIKLSDEKLSNEDKYCEVIAQKRIWNHFHEYIRRKLLEMLDAQNVVSRKDGAGTNRKMIMETEAVLVERLMEPIWSYLAANPDTIIICDEIGCGLIPMDAFERQYRDIVGRCMCELTKQAKEVVRITCGLPTWMKE